MPSLPPKSIARFSAMLPEVAAMTPNEILSIFSRAEIIHIARSLCWHGIEKGMPSVDLSLYILAALERGMLPDLRIFEHRATRKIEKNLNRAIGNLRSKLNRETDPAEWTALWESLQTLERIKVEKSNTEQFTRSCAAALELDRLQKIENERIRHEFEKHLDRVR